MDWQQAQKELITQLIPLYGDREAAVIADWTMENLSGWKKIDRLLHRSTQLPPETFDLYQKYSRELLAHRPVQYVLHESWFAGMKLYVDENVLIPRPETEELVEWAIQTTLSSPTPQSTPSAPPSTGPSQSPEPPGSPIILDVGTGSGCIAITLALQLPGAQVHAVDISTGALTVAGHNAQNLQAPVRFHQLDFLDPQQWPLLPQFTSIVSNPPYIPDSDKTTMAPHVLKSEPHLALFVPDNDPLLFYDALARFAKKHLSPRGFLFAEIHEALGPAAVQLFRKAGFQEVILRKDMQGNDRMIRAR
ncbi:MAG TPA: peptide chain release factor N(5)-glutamine methyltransferase [Puia sp.]|jgi:release factor glutamine methyltransferase|nr:peptide chain release factor N(5)-glutamine methyltransferase [Puia sp.]